MDFELTTEQRRIQSLARDFARDEVAPLARVADEQRAFPMALLPRMAALGLLGGPIAAEYGGAGMDAVSFALVCEELGRARFVGARAIHRPCQPRRWLHRRNGAARSSGTRGCHALPAGRSLGCYCLTEPEAGSDAASIATTAHEDGDGFVLNGEKIWITNGTLAGLAIVFATRDPARHVTGHLRVRRADRHAGLRCASACRAKSWGTAPPTTRM